MSLKALYEKYGENVEFIAVYGREAHPSDGWWFGRSRTQRLAHALSGNPARVDVPQPRTLEERRTIAEGCRSNLLDGVPLFVDEIDNPVSTAYAAYPTRIYLIGRDGRVAYNPGIGPMAFNPSHLEPVIQDYLGDG